jgi:predicted small secreted protein
MISKSRIFTLALCAALTLGAAACETVEGAGRDLEHAGEAVQRAAD